MPSKAYIAGRLPVRRGLDESEAAVYLSFSPTFFRSWWRKGACPGHDWRTEGASGMSRSWTWPSRRCRAKAAMSGTALCRTRPGGSQSMGRFAWVMW